MTVYHLSSDILVINGHVLSEVLRFQYGNKYFFWFSRLLIDERRINGIMLMKSFLSFGVVETTQDISVPVVYLSARNPEHQAKQRKTHQTLFY
jgi:hypothetical protein